VFDNSIVQGKAMTGILQQILWCQIGFIAGGDYELRNQNFSNKALTTDGGKHGISLQKIKVCYASCVQYVPKSNGKGLVSVGFQDCIILWWRYLMEKLASDATLIQLGS
jgi:hypothetical protein